MKLANIKRIAREELQGAPDWIDQLLTPLNQSTEQITQAIMGQLSLADNQFARLVTQKVTQNTELVIKNPFSDTVKPIGIVPIASDSPYTLESWRYNYKTNGDLGVTFNFGVSPSYLFLTRNANQSIADVSDVSIQWTTAQANSGVFSWATTPNPSRIAVTNAGRYAFSYTMAFAGNATGKRMAWLSKNGVIAGTASRYAQHDLPNNGAGEPWLVSGTAEIDLASGGYVELYCRQNSGGGFLDALGNAAEEVQITAHSLAYSGYSANVTFVVYGG